MQIDEHSGAGLQAGGAFQARFAFFPGPRTVQQRRVPQSQGQTIAVRPALEQERPGRIGAQAAQRPARLAMGQGGQKRLSGVLWTGASGLFRHVIADGSGSKNTYPERYYREPAPGKTLFAHESTKTHEKYWAGGWEIGISGSLRIYPFRIM
jgi:hypothetical protein